MFVRIISNNYQAIVIESLVAIVATLSTFRCLIYAQSNPAQRFAIEPSDKTAIVGDTVILPCRVVNKVGTLQWTRDGFGLGTDRILNGFPRYSMIGTDDEGDYSLQISQVSLEDDATFQCQVGAADGVRGIRSRSAMFAVFLPPDPPLIVQSRVQGEYLRTTAGMTIELTCEAHNGKPPAELTWLDRDGNPVNNNIAYTTYKLNDGKRYNAALKWIFNVTKDYDGSTLTCRSENPALKIPAQTGIRIEVKYAPEVQLRVVTTSTSLRIGDDVQFECAAVGNPRQLLYKWFKNDEIIAGDHSARLEIKSAGRELNGATIACEVSNSVGTTRAQQSLSVSYGPSFGAAMESVVAVEAGGDARLVCAVDGNPRPEITWLKVGSSVVLGQGAEMVIPGVGQANAGEYTCRASMKGYDEISARILLLLKSPPRIMGPYLQFGVEGETARVECLVESIPMPTKLLWYRNAQVVDVDNNRNYEIIEESIPGESSLRSAIVIRKSKPIDFGAYNCSVWNQYGSDSKLITLVPQSRVTPMLLMVGFVISGVVFFVATAIVIIICAKRRPTLDTDSYQSDYKKSSANYYNQSLDSDSDIKVEIRTASSLSQHWSDDKNNIFSDGYKESSKAGKNIYGYANQFEPSMFNSIFHHNSAANDMYAPFDYPYRSTNPFLGADHMASNFPPPSVNPNYGYTGKPYYSTPSPPTAVTSLSRNNSAQQFQFDSDTHPKYFASLSANSAPQTRSGHSLATHV